MHGASTITKQLLAQRDELFSDATRHGPRVTELVIRCVAAVACLALGLGLGVFLAYNPSEFGDIALQTAPMLVAVCVAAGLVASLARVPTLPLVAGAVVFALISTILVIQGLVVFATLPGAVAAILLGFAAARAVYRAVWVLPILIVAALSDLHSVRAGFTRSLLANDASSEASISTDTSASVAMSIPQSSVQFIDFLVIHLPLSSSAFWMIGLVDIAAVGLLLAISHISWQPIARSVLAIIIALVFVAWLGKSIALLPAIGVAWVVVNWRLVYRATRFSFRRFMYLGG